MTAFNPLTALEPIASDRLAPAKVCRSAFYLQSQGQPLFAWLHQPFERLAHGIVMCAPLGYEQVHAHRTWRYLADALAGAGFPALRFDYHGTGDSAGVDEDPDRVATWLANIRDACRFLRETAGCDKISLVGLRMGASLAMQAAATEDIDGLLLWAPVVQGRHFVREMKALGLTAPIKAAPSPEAPDDVDGSGFVLARPTADALSKIDLLQVQPRCRRALILARDDGPEDHRLLDHLRSLDIVAATSSLPGYADMMAEPHFTKVPTQAIAYMVDWLRAGAPAPMQDAAEPNLELPDEAFVASGIRERPVTLGAASSLFGVMAEPIDDINVDLPTIVMLNAGAAYRIGPSRLHVLLARSLATKGFRSLRLDFAILGDSVPVGSAGSSDAYAENSFRDIEAALRVLRDQGHGRVALLGLCSGAYFAFQSAVQMADLAIVESVLINPLTFFWKDGMSIDMSPTLEDQVADYYWKSALEPGKWLKLLSGQTKIGYHGALAQLWRRCLRSQSQEMPMEPDSDGPAAHPKCDDLTADLARLARRGRPLSCFISKADPGYRIMTNRASSKVQELMHAGMMSVAFMDDADHTFSFRAPRLALVRAIGDHFLQRYQR